MTSRHQGLSRSPRRYKDPGLRGCLTRRIDSRCERPGVYDVIGQPRTQGLLRLCKQIFPVYRYATIDILSIQGRFCLYFKDDVKSVLRVGSAHNKGGRADINIFQISHLSNFSEL